jgi:hypothetical protein
MHAKFFLRVMTNEFEKWQPEVETNVSEFLCSSIHEVDESLSILLIFAGCGVDWA